MEPTENPKLLYSAEETAKILSISKATVMKLVKLGTLPHIRIGVRKLIPVSAVEAFAANLVVVNAPITKNKDIF